MMPNENTPNPFNSQKGHAWMQNNDPQFLAGESGQNSGPSPEDLSKSAKPPISGSPPSQPPLVPRRIQDSDAAALQAKEPNKSQEIPGEFCPPIAEIVNPTNSEQINSEQTNGPGDQIDRAAEAIRALIESEQLENDPAAGIVPPVAMPKGEQAEPSDAWIDERRKPKDGRASDSQKTTKPSQEGLALSERQVASIVDEIQARFPAPAPVVLLFVSDSTSANVDETTARVCSELEKRSVGRILLVDSDFDERGLTSVSGFSEEPGLAECFSGSVHWRESVHRRGSHPLEFLSAGRDRMHWYDVAPKRLDRITADLKMRYTYVCVSAGSAHSRSAKIWMNHCDGTYLVVNLNESCETAARSAVAELKENGARLIGCVVTEDGE